MLESGHCLIQILCMYECMVFIIIASSLEVEQLEEGAGDPLSLLFDVECLQVHLLPEGDALRNVQDGHDHLLLPLHAEPLHAPVNLILIEVLIHHVGGDLHHVQHRVRNLVVY